MKAYIISLFSLSLLLCSCTQENPSPLISFTTDHFQLSLNNKGQVKEMTDRLTGKNYLASDTLSPLISIRVAGEIVAPTKAEWVGDDLQFSFSEAITAVLSVEEKATHLTLELLKITPADRVELIIWGPYATQINQTIGETVGVVRNDSFAIGIQSLNIKTLGGYPWNESDRMPAFDIFREEDWANMHPDSDGSVLYRVEAAKPMNNGSSLQAYCRNRSKPRIIQDFRHEKIVAPPYPDGGVEGSKIALFGCPKDQALATLGAIELAEGLPHPRIDGQWAKEAPGAAAAYLISDFTEANVDQAIELTQKAGLRYLYHYGKTFESWGEFELFKGEFPEGRESLRRCVEKAEAAGIMLGTHVLSNFITTNDPYVSPIPDDRLAIVGGSKLTKSVSKEAKEIHLASPEFFNQMENNSLKTVRVGDELIRYGQVSDSAPWVLSDCQRGAFGTRAAAHSAGDTIVKLLDHAYKVFLSNADLTIEMSKTMADLYNDTGLRQISFDGLEGNRSTGLGTYGESLMPYTWYNALNEELKNHLIIDASRTTHFFWHIYTRMNWGEPWYGGFRESQTEYRFNNQAYFQRNYMPGMLGWFKMTAETSLEDMEWLLARSAGYDAGYAFVANTEVVRQNGLSDRILTLIGDWEQLRIKGVFTEDQKEKMRGTDTEFSLQSIGEGEWTLSPVRTLIITHSHQSKQPGEPSSTTFDFENIGEEQVVKLIIKAENSPVTDIGIEIDNYRELRLPITLQAGEILRYEAGDQADVYNSSWQLQRRVPFTSKGLLLSPGKHSINFDCTFLDPMEEARVKVEWRSLGIPDTLVLPKGEGSTR